MVTRHEMTHAWHNKRGKTNNGVTSSDNRATKYHFIQERTGNLPVLVCCQTDTLVTEIFGQVRTWICINVSYNVLKCKYVKHKKGWDKLIV